MKKVGKVAGERVREYTYRAILQNIITLELPPGSAMSENELSAFFGVSRTPVREAISELRRADLVEVVPQIGSFVTKVDYSLIDDAQFVRMALENEVVRCACSDGIAEPYLYQLRYNVFQQQKCGEGAISRKEYLMLDNEFHRLLFAAVGREKVYEFVQMKEVHFERLHSLSERFLHNRMTQKKIEDRVRILHAVEKRDVLAAKEAMTVHLERYLEEKEELKKCCPEYFVESYSG